jgi:hypothetical protein
MERKEGMGLLPSGNQGFQQKEPNPMLGSIHIYSDGYGNSSNPVFFYST